MSSIKEFFSEVRRRKILRATVIYAAVAWVAIQVVVAVFPTLGFPEWMTRTLVVILLAGVPVAIVVSWIFDFNPDRLKLDATAPVAGDPAPSSLSGQAVHSSADKFAAAINIPSPSPPSDIVGREQAVQKLVEMLLSDSRIVTITGPGGTGKTRLAIEVSTELRSEFPGGFAFLQLAHVTDPENVMPAIARALDVHEAEGRSMIQGVATLIGERRVLFVLDNLEQVIDAAPDVATLLADTPNLKILVTSRAPLRIAGEREYNLQPLPVPGTDVSVDELSSVPSVRLFTDRAAVARSDFILSDANAEAVAKLCKRLDGLPLALELAAARIRVLEPDALLERLDHALDVLTVGARDLPERQRTLRATIDWSHGLLDENEQRLFRRMAVFASGCEHTAIESVCYEDDSVHRELDEVSSLVEKGLVYSDKGRFSLLQTIRDFAREKLEESGEEDKIRRRHADFFHDLALKMWDGHGTLEQLKWMEVGDTETANLMEAFDYFKAGAGNDDSVQKGLAMCGALWFFWHIRGLHAVGRDLARFFLEADVEAAASIPRLRAMRTLALGMFGLGDVHGSVPIFVESMEMAKELGSEIDVVDCGSCTGITCIVAGDPDAARPYLEEAVTVGRKLGADMSLGLALYFLGILELTAGNLDAATASLDEGLAAQQRINDYEGMGGSLSALAAVAGARGEHMESVRLYRESIEAFDTVGDRPEEARVLGEIAWQYLALEDVDEARNGFLASLRAYEEVGSIRGIGVTLYGLAAAEAVEGRADRAVRLAAAAGRFAEEEGVVVEVASGIQGMRYIEAAREELLHEEVDQLSADGRAMSVDEAVRFVLMDVETVGVLV